MELQLCRLLDCVPQGMPGPEDPCCAVSSPAFGSEHRQIRKPEDSRRGSQTWGLALEKKCVKVRESRPSSSKLAEAADRSADGLQDGGKVHVRNLPRPKMPRHTTSLRSAKGTYVADLFSGHGGVARAMRAAGFTCRERELLKGPDNDLTNPCVVSKLFSDIHKGRVLGAMLAPPCSSFSPARDRTSVIRNKQYPWGKPGLTEREREVVLVGNRCFRSALKIVKVLDKSGLPWILENPHSSKCWYLPPLKRLAGSSHVHTRVLDFCQYGTRWSKRTRMLLGNIDQFDSLRLSTRLCSGHGFCSRTGHRHFQLTGSNRQGIPWTRIAQPYPARLCHDLAYVLIAQHLVVPYEATATH